MDGTIVASRPASRRDLRGGIALLAVSLLVGCGGPSKLATPIPLEMAAPVATAADERLAVSIDAVIVRDGPGSWAKGANWDEYLLQVRSLSAGHMQITHIVVVDSLGGRHRARTPVGELEKASKATARRYEDAGLQVTAGRGAELLVAGQAVTTAAAVGYATAGSAAAVGTAAAAAAGGAALVGTGALVVVFQEAELQGEISRRSRKLPLQMKPRQALSFHAFFPLAPAPERVEVQYVDASGKHVLVIDTREPLAGLHLPPASQPATLPPVEVPPP
jgi:hypothetical protein